MRKDAKCAAVTAALIFTSAIAIGPLSSPSLAESAPDSGAPSGGQATGRTYMLPAITVTAPAIGRSAARGSKPYGKSPSLAPGARGSR